MSLDLNQNQSHDHNLSIQYQSSKRIEAILHKISNNQSNFKNLMSHYIKKSSFNNFSQKIKSNRQSKQDMQINELQNKSQKVKEQKIVEVQNQEQQKIYQIQQDTSKNIVKNNPYSQKITKIIKQINERQIKTVKKIPLYEQPLSKSKIKKQQVVRQQQSPIPRMRFNIDGRDQLKHHPSNQQNNQQLNQNNVSLSLKKSYLDFDPQKFKKNLNGSLVRISPPKIQQEINSRIQKIKPKNNQAIILNMNLNKPSQINNLNLANSNLSQRNKNTNSRAFNNKKSISLVDLQFQKMKKYIDQNELLNPSSDANTIYNFFNNMSEYIDVKFQTTLIKKYKNCIYFGQNPINCGIKGVYQGILYHYNIKIYFGEFVNSKKCGRGCQILLKQNIVSKGNFDFGNKIGFFKILKYGQYQYQGEVNNGLFEGKGILKTKISKYQGMFKNNYKDGYGKQQFYLTGEIYIGNYVNGNFQGMGSIKSKNYIYEGEFRQNLKQGQGYEKNEIQQYKGTFFRGKRQGKGILQFSNGDIYIGQFKQGRLYGKGEYQYANKQMISGYFVNDRLVSEEKKYYQTKNFASNKKINESKKEILEVQENFEQGPSKITKIQKSKIFNPNKLLKFTPLQQQQSFTQRPVFHSGIRKPQYQFGQMTRRNSELQRSKIADEYNIEKQKPRYQSNQRKSNVNNDFQKFNLQIYTQLLKNKKINESQNHYSNLDYYLADNSMEEDLPSFPAIQNKGNIEKRMKYDHTEDPLRRFDKF